MTKWRVVLVDVDGWDGGARKSSSIIRGEDIKQIECGSTRSLVYNDINALAWARVDALSSNARVRTCVRGRVHACGRRVSCDFETGMQYAYACE